MVEYMPIFRRLWLVAICISCSGFVCSGQSLAPGFHWDWRRSEKNGWESLGQSQRLSAPERAELIQTLASQLRPAMSNMGIETEQELRETVARTRIKLVDLSGNGTREVAAQAVGNFSCSPTGNCDCWIFRKRGGKYSLILHRSATQNFTIQPTLTRGFHDLVLGQHGSATEQGLGLYRFNGAVYRRTACYDAKWQILGQDGKPRDLKEPQITSFPCPARR